MPFGRVPDALSRLLFPASLTDLLLSFLAIASRSLLLQPRAPRGRTLRGGNSTRAQSHPHSSTDGATTARLGDGAPLLIWPRKNHRGFLRVHPRREPFFLSLLRRECPTLQTFHLVLQILASRRLSDPPLSHSSGLFCDELND